MLLNEVQFEMEKQRRKRLKSLAASAGKKLWNGTNKYET